VPFGASAVTRLAEILSELQAEDLLRAVTVIVPSSVVGLHLRRRLVEQTPRDGPGLANVRFSELSQAARLLAGWRLSPDKAMATPTVIREATREALANTPGLANYADNNLAVAAFDKALQELRRLPAEEIPNRIGDNRQVENLFTRFRAILSPYYDAEDLLEMAAKMVSDFEPSVKEMGAVILYLPEPSSPRRNRLIHCFLLQGAKAVVGLSGDEADTSVLDWLVPFNSALTVQALEPPPQTRVRCSVLIDPLEEVRYAVRETMRLASAGAAFPRIAILSPAVQPYQPAIEEALAAADIPVHGRGFRTLRETPSGRAVEGFLRIANGSFSRSEVIDWVKSVALKDPNGPIEGTLWGRIARDAHVTRGLANWNQRLSRYAAQPQFSDVGDTSNIAEEATRLAQFVNWLEGRRSGAHSDWRAAIENLVKILDENLDPSGFSERDFEHDRLVREGLRSMGTLELLKGVPTWQSLSMAVAETMEAPIPQTSRYGSGVFRGTLNEAVAMDFDHVFLLGMCEGSLPGAIAGDPILDSKQGRAGSTSEVMHLLTQRRLYRAIRTISPDLTLSCPRVDRNNGRPHLPAVWFLEEATALLGTGVPVYSADLASLRGKDWMHFPVSAEASLKDREQVAASRQEYHLKSMLERPGRLEGSVLMENAGFAAGVEMQRERKSSAFSVFDGNVGPNDWLNESVLSASSLENFAACPQKFFYDSVLGVRSTESPSDSDSLDPTDRGNALHAIFKRYIDGGELTQEAMESIAEQKLDLIEREGITGPPILWSRERERLKACALNFVGAHERFTEIEGATPLETEWSFGKDRPFILSTSDFQLMVSGRIDRIDRVGDQPYWVVDYKTGSFSKFRKIDQDPFLNGELVQLPLYGLVVAQWYRQPSHVNAVYMAWDKSRENWTPLRLKLTEKSLEEFLENLSIFASRIQSGVFPARPGPPARGTYANCAYCPFDLCCPSDRASGWQRIEASSQIIPLQVVSNRYQTAPTASNEISFEEIPSPSIDSEMRIEVDDDDQARARIAQELDKTLFVEAGAGTGKTTCLVDRITRMIVDDASPVSLSNIAAITYTRKAAGELYERLRGTLESLVRISPTGLLDSAIRQIDSASIGTIDGFARTILTRYSIEAGLPPGFTVLDEIEAQLKFDEWWRVLKEELLLDPDLSAAWTSALDANIGPDRLETFAHKLHQRWEKTPPTLDLNGAQADLVIADLLNDVVEKAARMLEFERAVLDRDDLLYQKNFLDLQGWLSALGQTSNPDATENALDRKFPINVGKKTSWAVPVLEVKQAITELRGTLNSLKDRVAANRILGQIAPLLERICAAVRSNALNRQQEGALEFHDLLVLTARLLRNDPTVRSELRRQYQRILVDEFQDTDPLQIEIFAILASDEKPAENWRQTNFSPGRIFFVGDPKQSLYRFRGADLDVYQTARGIFSGEVRRLTKNYRSHRQVIDFVNQAFGVLLDCPGQAEPLALGAHRTGDDEPRVHGFGGRREGMDASEIRAEEAHQLAKIVKTIVTRKTLGEPGWRVEDPTAKEMRPARFRDVAILIPSRTVLAEIERQFEIAAIPYRIDSRTLIYSTQQVRDLIALLKAIDDPTDEVAVVASLRSPIFGCSDRLLFEHRHHGWNYRKVRSEGADLTLVESAMNYLNDLHQIRTAMPVAGLVSKIVRERFLMELALQNTRTRDQWRRIERIVSDAQAFDACTGGSLGAFLEYIEALSQHDAHVNEAIVEEEDDDAVKILTIHASKGLEFPIVAMVGLSSEGKPPEAVKLLWDDAGNFEFVLGANPRVSTAGANDLLAEERVQLRLEDDRKLYVAATRARDHLIVSFFHKAALSNEGSDGGNGGSMASRLYRSVDHSQVAKIDLLESDSVIEEQRLPPYEGRELPFEDWLADHVNGISQGTPSPTRSPSQIAQEMCPLNTSPVDDDHDEDESLAAGRRSRGGVSLGRVVHTVLQTIDMRDPTEGLERVVRARAQGESQDFRAVRRLVERALDSQPFKEAAGSFHRREMFVSAYCEGILLEGYIDLIYRKPDGRYVLVDYKTDAVFTELAVSERVAKYRFQAAVYALMIEQNLGQPPAEFLFVFLEKGEPNVSRVGDLPQAMEEVRAYLREVRSIRPS
jgi:ATP-dependent helicase/nuclease subunit A